MLLCSPPLYIMYILTPPTKELLLIVAEMQRFCKDCGVLSRNHMPMMLAVLSVTWIFSSVGGID